MSPPAPAISATESAATSDPRARAGWPAANAHWSIAMHAAVNASTAAIVCTRSCQVNVSPTGRGHPAVQLTCDATRNQPHAIQSMTDGATPRRMGGRERMSHADHAIADPPATIARSAASNQCSVGMPTAPSSET